MLPAEIEEKKDQIQIEVEKNGAELIDIRFQRDHGRNILMVIVDKVGGISLDECSQINRGLGQFFDSLSTDNSEESKTSAGCGFFEGRYLLEVASPGLDRPIQSEKDFLRATGSKVNLFVKNENNRQVVAGKIVGVVDGAVRLQLLKDAEVLSVPMTSIEKAVRVIEFKRPE